uniref:Integrin_alpha2 domain-containing protein n=1 Tax=Anisakis simplex TaxID=6269 RepID=A0A0M3JBT2_ANISI
LHFCTYQVPLPVLRLSPGSFIVPESGSKNYSFVAENIGGSSEAIIMVPPFMIDDYSLPFRLILDGIRNGIGLHDGYRTSMQLTQRTTNITDKRCNVYSIRVPYYYTMPRSISNYLRYALLIVDDRHALSDANICEGLMVEKCFLPCSSSSRIIVTALSLIYM